MKFRIAKKGNYFIVQQNVPKIIFPEKNTGISFALVTIDYVWKTLVDKSDNEDIKFETIEQVERYIDNNYGEFMTVIKEIEV